jgi:regulator of sigma E protease
LPARNVTYGIHPDSLGRKIGLQEGDKIVGVDNKAIDNFNTIGVQLVLGEAETIQVERDGRKMSLPLPDGFVRQLNKNKLEGFVDIRFPVIVDSVDKSKAKFVENQLQKGDTLIGINGQPFKFYNQFDSLKKGLKNQEVVLTALRNEDTVHIKAVLDENSAVGFFAVSNLSKLFKTVTHKYGLIESIPVGINRCWETLGRYITGLKQIFSGKVSANDSLGSVISIGNTFPGVWDWQRFWQLTAIFSIILAFMNILPIPALDGGHALFTVAEMVSGRKPSDKFMEYAQMVGMVLLLGLMAYALGLDFWRLFK